MVGNWDMYYAYRNNNSGFLKEKQYIRRADKHHLQNKLSLYSEDIDSNIVIQWFFTRYKAAC